MRIVSLDKLKTGDVLGKSLFDERGQLLLSSGYTLTEDMIKAIEKHGYRFVYVMDEITSEIIPEEVISDTIRQTVNQNLANTFKNVQKNLAFETFASDEIKKRLLEDAKIRKMVDLPDLRRQVNMIIDEIVENNISMFTALPMKSNTGAAHQHAFDTTVLSILIAQIFRYDDRESRALGTAAMIHDIGKLAFERLMGKNYNELNRDEKMLLREHPVFSMLILKGSNPESFIEQSTVMQHHERYDGRGYPGGLKSLGLPPVKQPKVNSKVIFRHAEILAVANAYDNLISGHEDGVQYSPDEALVFLINDAGKAYNPHVVNALTKVIQCYPVGATVRIRKTRTHAYEGYTGVVQVANPADQTKPVVLLTNNVIGAPITPKAHDLSSENYVALELVL